MCKRIVGNISLAIVLIWISLPWILLFQDTKFSSEMLEARSMESVETKIVSGTVNQMKEVEIKLADTLDEVIELTELNATETSQDNFGAEITFTGEYICDGDVMPYALYTPSTDEDGKKLLIVWLHGLGEVNTNVNTFLNQGLPAIINGWGMEGFNAYILCPHLTGSWNSGRWNTETAKDNLQELMDDFIMEHNVDTENIIIVGHSLGGQGVLYMAHELPYYFSRCIVLSGYNPGIEIGKINIPTIGYVGTSGAGEDGASINYMKTSFVQVFGEENFFSIPASHGAVPKIAFNLDENYNNRSDLIEWMFGEL